MVYFGVQNALKLANICINHLKKLFWGYCSGPRLIKRGEKGRNGTGEEERRRGGGKGGEGWGMKGRGTEKKKVCFIDLGRTDVPAIVISLGYNEAYHSARRIN
jgi:hypothetical protein